MKVTEEIVAQPRPRKLELQGAKQAKSSGVVTQGSSGVCGKEMDRARCGWTVGHAEASLQASLGVEIHTWALQTLATVSESGSGRCGWRDSTI